MIPGRVPGVFRNVQGHRRCTGTALKTFLKNPARTQEQPKPQLKTTHCCVPGATPRATQVCAVADVVLREAHVAPIRAGHKQADTLSCSRCSESNALPQPWGERPNAVNNQAHAGRLPPQQQRATAVKLTLSDPLPSSVRRRSEPDSRPETMPRLNRGTKRSWGTTARA